MSQSDGLQRFSFDSFPVRGQLVRLEQSYAEVIKRHTYPEAVQIVLGEALAATVLLASTLKFDGRMTLQIQGDGPLSMVVVQCTDELELRALARWQGDTEDLDFRQLVGQGRLAITVTTDRRRQPYQGVVPLTGASLNDCLSAYFETSEQLPTRIWLAAGQGRCAGLLLQRIPDEFADEHDDDWRRVQLLADTLNNSAELLQIDYQPLLRRLFHEDDLRLYEMRDVSFSCTCSGDRVETVLRALGEEELRSILAEQGEISVTCEFCNQKREFDRVDVEQLLIDGPATGSSNSLH